jgi:hypothetical protein
LLPAGAFAGWDLHPLESAAFSRRTQIPVIGRRLDEGVKSTRCCPSSIGSGAVSFGSLNI